jgi:CHRD domain-containing protein
MRRLIISFVVACVAAATAVSAAPAKNGKGTMCVLHAKLTAKNETPPTTSTAKGHTLIKVRTDGTIEFKTQINNKNHETFIAGHIHPGTVGVANPFVVPLFMGPATTARHIKQSGVATPNPSPPTATGAQLCQNPSAYYVNYHTALPGFPAGAIRGQLH